MQLIGFNSYEQNAKMYGGTAGRKMGICYNGRNYLLKFPGNLKEQQMKNIRLSYSNSPVCEYIGSQIYSLLGFEVHNTILGVRSGKTVVACEDFLETGDILYEFDKIKVTFEPHFLDSSGNETNGVGVDLFEIMMTIQEHPFLRDIEGVEEHFWNMFVVDAFIGNTDRNNSNWGIIVHSDGSKKIAPIYDNGNCLDCKWDDEKMEYAGCSESIKNIVPRIEKVLPQIIGLIQEIPILSMIQKQFYTTVLKKRYYSILMPVYQRLMEKELCNEEIIQDEGWCG